MATIKLYGVAASRTFRNIWMLKELGLPYEHDPIAYNDKALKAPPYTDLNPNGRVPFIVVDGMPLFESLAINQYLADKFGGDVAATNAEERAQISQWSLWGATSVETDLGNWAYHTMFLPEAERKPEVAKQALENIKAPLAILDGVLAKREYLVGNRFTVADLNVAAVCYRALGLDMPDKPHFKAWLAKCWSRPAAIEARRARGDKV
ncbi:MAG: glutathione S-transferase family protein [Casimicrobium sp.]